MKPGSPQNPAPASQMKMQIRCHVDSTVFQVLWASGVVPGLFSWAWEILSVYNSLIVSFTTSWKMATRVTNKGIIWLCPETKSLHPLRKRRGSIACIWVSQIHSNGAAEMTRCWEHSLLVQHPRQVAHSLLTPAPRESNPLLVPARLHIRMCHIMYTQTHIVKMTQIFKYMTVTVYKYVAYSLCSFLQIPTTICKN